MNTVKIDREMFAEVLEMANKFVLDSNVIPMFDSIRLSVEPTRAEIIAANPQMQIRLFVPCKSDAAFMLCIPANLLYKTVSAFREQVVTISHKKEKIVEVKSGKSKYSITMDVQPEHFTIMDPGTIHSNITIRQTLLQKALKGTRKFLKDQHPTLCATNIAERDNKIIFTGAQGPIMCRVAVRPMSITSWKGCSIPEETSKRMASLLTGKGEIDVSHSDTKIRFSNDIFEVISVLHDCKYPDTEKFFSQLPSKAGISMSTVELTDAVHRLRLYCPTGEVPLFDIENQLNPMEVSLTSFDTVGCKSGFETILVNNPDGHTINKTLNNDFMLTILREVEHPEVSIMFDDSNLIFVLPKVDNPEEDMYSFMIAPAARINEPVSTK